MRVSCIVKLGCGCAGAEWLSKPSASSSTQDTNNLSSYPFKIIREIIFTVKNTVYYIYPCQENWHTDLLQFHRTVYLAVSCFKNALVFGNYHAT